MSRQPLLCGLGLNLAHKIGCHGNIRGGIKILTFSHSTNDANLVKIGLVDVEITGLAEIVKKQKKKPKQNISPPSAVLHVAQVG